MGRCIDRLVQHGWRRGIQKLMSKWRLVNLGSARASNVTSGAIAKRLFDCSLSLASLIVLAVPLAVVGLAVRLTSVGPILYWSRRIGRNNEIFMMPKFRSMHITTPEVATHVLENPNSYHTPIGSFLRRTSVDELPQLWSILKGDMSIVGPRPALFNQVDLVRLRTDAGIHVLLPGLTGLAQINGRGHLSIDEKVRLDQEYLFERSFYLDIWIIYKTALTVFIGERVSN